MERIIDYEAKESTLLPTDIVERNLHSMRDAIDEAMKL